jgi:Tol biopolymer transport system component
VLAFIALILVGAASYFVVSFLDASIDTAAAEATEEPAATAEAPGRTAQPEITEAPATVEPEATDEATEPEASDAIVEDTPEPEPEATAEPILVVPPSDERADITGSLVFTRLGGDIWSASGTTLDPLTNSNSTKSDSTPTWSPDGKHIYFIRSAKKTVKDGKARFNGKYTLYPTDVMRMNADGSNKKKVFNSLINDGRGIWFSTVVQPSVSPAGNNIAVISDGRDGTSDAVTLHILNSRTGRVNRVDTPYEVYNNASLGHNDPDFNRDGTRIAFTYNENAGTEADPRIAILTCQTKTKCTTGKTKYLKSGYANPSWSPDGKLLAVETTDGSGRDIAIITSSKGVERVQLTNDGDSFAPEFSPNGDQIAYLKRDGLDIDVRVMTLDIDEKGKITLVADKAVTSDGTVDGQSGVSWYIPRNQLDSAASVDAAEPDASEEPDEVLDEAPPPPPGS